MRENLGVLSRRLLNLTCVLLSAHFALAHPSFTRTMVPFDPDKNMGASGPFSFRMLPVLLWKFVAFLFGPIGRRVPKIHAPHMNPPLNGNLQWFIALLTFLAMLGTLLIARRMMRTIDPRWGFEWISLGIGYAAYFDTILVLNRNLWYSYDIPALFFFTALVYLAFHGRAATFALTLAVAMLNKETAVMSVLVYFGLQYGKQPLARLMTLCGSFGALALGVRAGQLLYLRRICQGCRLTDQNQLHDNLPQLINPLFWLSESSVFGFAWVALLLFWRYVPRNVRITFTVVCSIWLLGMTVVGILREVRIFSELSALLLLTLGLGVHGWLEQRASPNATTA